MDTNKNTQNQSNYLSPVLLSDIWRYMLGSPVLMLIILLGCVVAGLAAAFVPEPRYKVSARITPPSVVEVQSLSAVMNSPGDARVILHLENVEITNFTIKESSATSIEMISQLVFYEYLRNLDSIRKREQFLKEQIKKFPENEARIRQAIESVKHKTPRSRNLTFLSAFIHMDSKLDPESSASLLNEFLDFLDRETRENIASFASFRLELSSGELQDVSALLDPGDFRVVTIDQAASPPKSPSIPNRKLVIITFTLLGFILSVLVSMYMCVKEASKP